MFSKSCEYGIKAVIYIATQSMEQTRVKTGDIAENIGSPEAFTAKILGALVRQGIIKSITGPYGGFEMDQASMKKIKLSDIVFALDGDSIYNGCGLGLSQCNDANPCPMHNNFVKVRAALKSSLEINTVYDLAIGVQSGMTRLIG